MKKDLHLMHKNIVVASLSFDNDKNTFHNITIFNQKHMPIGTHNPRLGNLSRALSEWSINRCIPQDRPNCSKLASKLDISNIISLINKTFMCSLTDCYWFKPQDMPQINWEDVNFFENGFTSNIGKLLFMNNFSATINNLHSPDLTTNGALAKLWFQNEDKTFYLLKDGFRDEKSNSKHEVVSEVFAYEVLKKYHINATPYFFCNVENKVYSVCPNFVQNDATEFVPMENVSQDFNGSKRMAYKKFCELGLKGDMDKIVVIDYLIGNGDRHHNNIGYLRNPNTLEILGLAPCFDNGACMSYDYNSNKAVENAGAKLYYRDEVEELSLVDDFSWFKNSNVTCEELCEIYHNLAQGKLDQKAISDVLQEFTKRYEFLKEYIQEKEMNYNVEYKEER